jgi:hypothetical protein
MFLDSTFCFGLVSFVVLTPYVIWSGQIHQIDFLDASFMAYLIVSCTICVFHTYLTQLTLKMIGPIGVNITGICKDVFLTYIGFLMFDDVNVTVKVLFGLFLSFAGASYYVLARYRD